MIQRGTDQEHHVIVRSVPMFAEHGDHVLGVDHVPAPVLDHLHHQGTGLGGIEITIVSIERQPAPRIETPTHVELSGDLGREIDAVPCHLSGECLVKDRVRDNVKEDFHPADRTAVAMYTVLCCVYGYV